MSRHEYMLLRYITSKHVQYVKAKVNGEEKALFRIPRLEYRLQPGFLGQLKTPSLRLCRAG
jgi:hypothetical protein